MAPDSGSIGLNEMKRYFIPACFVVACLAASFVGYGLYLNTRSASYLITAQSQSNIGVVGMRARRTDMFPEIRLPGIGLYTQNITDVIAHVGGTVENLQAFAGMVVKSGDTLCTLEEPLIPLEREKAEADYRKAEAIFSHNKLALERAENLRTGKAISQSAYDTTEAEFQEAQAELAASAITLNKAKQQQDYQTVTAPLGGSVLIVYQRQGSRVNAGTPLMLLADFTTMVFTTHLSEAEYQNLMPADQEYDLAVNLDNSVKSFNANYYDTDPGPRNAVFDVRMLNVSPPAEKPANYRQVTWAVLNGSNVLEAGLYTNVIIRKKEPRAVLAVPARIITLLEEGPAVFVENADNRLDRRMVKTGVTDTRYMEITDGLAEGDVVIESDVLDLPLGTSISILENGNE